MSIWQSWWSYHRPHRILAWMLLLIIAVNAPLAVWNLCAGRFLFATLEATQVMYAVWVCLLQAEIAETTRDYQRIVFHLGGIR